MVNAGNLQKKLRPVFARYGIRKAILFGSVASGTNTENSDIDILVDSHLKGLQFVGLLEDIRQTCGAEIDLFDTAHIVKGSPVDGRIRETGRVIYEE